MPAPKEVFERPEEFWKFLTSSHDDHFEGQHFDRKEAGHQGEDGLISQNQLQKLIEQVRDCISAFANMNKEGGLLVLGICKAGRIKGIRHLTESQLNSLVNFKTYLLHQSAIAKVIECDDEHGHSNKICLIYIPYTERHICETPGASPKGCIRQGPQNIPLDDNHRERLKREKRIVAFENSYCCPYDPAELDPEVLGRFRKVYLQDANFERSDEWLLRQAGAVISDSSGLAFTNAGFLFFASNPQKILDWAYIRLLRFNSLAAAESGLPTFEKMFTGPITKQIREIRTFFKDSGFFKVYQRRTSDGGFIEEPEYPFIAIDEAIVNAVAHRDYAMPLPIRCDSYKDAFLVINSGRIQQLEHDVPEEFSLDNTRLDSIPGNPKLIEWLKMMRTEQGIPFVRALSEGTERMRREMAELGLPSPTYKVSNVKTTVILISNAEEREALLRNEDEAEPTEFANLFPLTFVRRADIPIETEERERRSKDTLLALRDALAARGWYVDVFKFSRMIAHRKGIGIAVSEKVNEIVRFFPAYVFQVRRYFGSYYLCIDYRLEVKSVRNLRTLLRHLKASDLVEKTATVNWKGWQRGRILSATEAQARIYLFDYDQQVEIESDRVIPQLPKSLIEHLLKLDRVKFDLHQAIKQHSLSTEPSAARIRFERSQTIAEELAETVFPLIFNGTRVNLRPSAVPLSRQKHTGKTLRAYSLSEPVVEFGHGHAEADIRQGITQFGAYNDSPKTIEIIPICSPELHKPMGELINRLKAGKYKYRGSERTFHTRFTYNTIIAASNEDTLSECKRLVDEHPDWIGNAQLDRLFLIHAAEQGYAIDDENSPYYVTKRYLLENGIPCQMIDTPTIQNPDWKDLNLALNIVAKCDVTPWVLPDAIPDADFFVGLSYTQNPRRGSQRLMGYANVFNNFGKWEFYSGNTKTFTFDQKSRYFQELVSQTLHRLTLSDTPSIYFHYSAKFSWDDRLAILNTARNIRPNGTYSFVWINSHHNVRLYDSRAETNGSLSRGSYVITSPNQLFLSTTGYNPYRKTLGTPEMLEINVTTEYPKGLPESPPDLKSIAVQILNLTKLNWASTDSLCAEPITTKYAGDIAYLTSGFLRQGGLFRLHPILEKTPWFL